jgi:pimeloyl-ACP methyl ester carboxylesterase
MTLLVLLPGMDGSGTMFGEFAGALGLKTLIVPYPRDQILDYEQLELYVDRLLPLDEPYLVLGESFSGPIAIRLAARGAPNLLAVVLVCTFARIAQRRPPRIVRALMSLLPFWRLPVAVGAARLFGRFDSETVRSQLAASIAGVLPAVWRSRMRSILDVDVTPQLQRIAVPVLYLRASEDRVVPAAAAAMIASHNPRARVVLVEGPHALLQANPTGSAAAIREFAEQAGVTL